MHTSNMGYVNQKEGLSKELKKRLKGKKEIIDNIELIDNNLTKLGLSNEILENAKVDYFLAVKKLENRINDHDQVNIYILSILKENQKTGVGEPTEEEILNTITELWEERTYEHYWISGETSY